MNDNWYLLGAFLLMGIFCFGLMYGLNNDILSTMIISVFGFLGISLLAKSRLDYLALLLKVRGK